ncbi:Fibronectin domain-containing protein [Oryctes borbonicus]|uniref:Fibronectin domain-containing protein n=1 Tax=Oryctes borbonicus TaxID=1629725 RepID=A0A0T6B0D7_9SCAR|nr:Fibronectin domain-containing protein [Oryctes borbonicus]
MVSTNSSPPVAMPVQVPPGHVVQQIVDESGTLRHVIISPQHPPGVLAITSHNPQHYGAAPPNGTNQPPQPLLYSPHAIPPNFTPHHFHSNIPPGHPAHVTSSANPGHSPPPSHQFYNKDERTRLQHIKLKKKLHRQQKGDSISPRKDLINGLRRSQKEKGMNSVGTSEDGEESSSVQDEEDSVQIITDMLSSVQAPKVSELSSRSALLQWAPPLRLSEASSNDSHELEVPENELRYEVLLSSDKGKEMKYKSIYSGDSLSCRIQDLRPGQEYSVCLQVHLEELQGAASEPTKFTTPPCEPDQPQPPKLLHRAKNNLQLRWNAVNDNGSHIQYYVLEYDEGKGGDFIELYNSKGRQYNLQKLQPATSYKFRLAAVNEVGKSLYSDLVTYTTSDNAPLQPSPPVLKEATVNLLHVQWHKRPRDEEFVLQVDKNPYGYIAIYNGPDTEYVHENLQRYTDYKFRLRSTNDGGMSPWSEEVTFQTLPDRPARPSKPVVKGRIHAHSFKLKWEPSSDTGGAEITKYILEVNSGSGYETVYTGTETEAVCDKLTPGTTYQLRVSCVSAGGRSNYSDPCTVTTDAISPGQCTGLKLHLKPRATSLCLRWIEPDYNGGAPVQEYELVSINADSSRSPLYKTKECEYNVTDLSPGTEYTFAVRAVNRIGPGPWSEHMTVTSGAAPPEFPINVTVVSKTPNHVFVSWSEPKDNGAPIKEYRVEYNSNESEDQFQNVFQGAGQNCDVKNLTPSTTYYFRVQACNGAGYGAFCPVVAAKTPPAPPSVVQIKKAESTPTSIHLSWHEPESNGSPIIHYNIEVGDLMFKTESADTAYTIESLSPDTNYKIKVQAVSEVGTGPFSSSLKINTARLPPAAPHLECIGVGHNHLKLKWGEGKNQDYTTYCLEMENSRTHEFQCIFKGIALTFKVNKLQELTTYRFRINAVNDAGEGDFSDTYKFTTTIAPPIALKAPRVVEVDQRTCQLEWTPLRNSTNDPIVYLAQLTRLRDQDYKQVYKGTETVCSLDNLEPGAEYCAKVCAIRMTSTGELLGPFSPAQTFSTVAQEPRAICKSSTTSVGGTPVHSHKHKAHSTWAPLVHLRSITDQEKIFLGALFMVIVGIVISMMIASVYMK